MGRTNRPLVIAVDDTLYNHPAIQELMDKGHVIYGLSEEWEREPDLVMGSHCWFMDVDHLPYLPIAMKEARKRKYGKKEDTED